MTRERTRRTRRSVQSARTRWDRGGSTTVAEGTVVVMEAVAMEVVRKGVGARDPRTREHLPRAHQLLPLVS
jgi:hypothetical protein